MYMYVSYTIQILCISFGCTNPVHVSEYGEVGAAKCLGGTKIVGKRNIFAWRHGGWLVGALELVGIDRP